MGRGQGFSPLEEELLRENYDRTIAELEELLRKNGYNRSKKSINRKLEKMREVGDIGMRSKDTIKRSYRQRARKLKGAPSELGPTGDTFKDNPTFGSPNWEEDDDWLD